MTKTEYRFWIKVDTKSKDECWNWKAGKYPNGYGFFRNGDSTEGSHRFAYESYYKCKIPKGKSVLHHCDNRACCNPNHLYCGTQSENMQDKVRRNKNLSKIISIACARFSASKILEIRSRKIKVGGRYIPSQKSVAKEFNINVKTVYRIWNSDRYMCKEGYYI